MKNIILITIDSLRADHLSCLGYHRKTAPNIDKLADNGILFTKALACGPDTPTSIVPLLTSAYVLRYYIESGGVDKLRTTVEEFERMRDVILEIYKHNTTIAEALKSHSYNTAAFHSNPFLSRYYHFGKGFDYFYDSLTFLGLKKYGIKRKITEILEKNSRLYDLAWYAYKNVCDKLKLGGSGRGGGDVPYERANEINKKAISWLKKHKENFFVWIHYMDVHFPYKPPKEFQFDSCSKLEMSNLNYKMLTRPEELSKDEIKAIINLYDGEIKYTDYAIKSLLEELSKMGILDDTLIIITADHGDEFGEHGDFAHYHAKLYDESLHVPLIIINSQLSPYRACGVVGQSLTKNIRIDEPVSLLDVFPTILDLMGIPATESFQGRSLMPIIRGERKSSAVISESLQKGKRNISYRTKEWKYILNEVESRRELYNTINDPEEKENLYEKERKRAKEFELKVTKHTAKQGEKIEGLTDEKERIKGRIKRLRGISKI